MSMTENGLQPPDVSVGTVEDHAEEWLIYLYSGKASNADFERFNQWLGEDPRHAAMYRRTEQLWQDMVHNDGYKEGADDDKTTGKIVELVNRQERRRKPLRASTQWKSLSKVAAGIAAVLVVGVVAYVGLRPAETLQAYSTEPGEIETVTLSDGSKVTLGGASVLHARFSQGRRSVELAAGGAYFAVTPDRTRPFQVRIDDVSVTVTGTEFDLRKNPEDVQVSVAKGHVKVGAVQSYFWDRSTTEVALKAGDQVLATSEGVGKISPFDPEVAFGWSQGHLVYEDEKLENVVAEVNRYRKDRIKLSSKTLGNRKVSLVIPIHETDLLLQALASGDGMMIQRTSTEVVVSAPR